jgi:hypothetical protein
MRKFLPGLAVAALLFSCNKRDFDYGGNGGKIPESISFQALSTLVIATDPTKPAGAAEISTFDPSTNRLFVVNNNLVTGVNRIEVVDLSNPSSPQKIGFISIAPYGGLVNSIDVSNGLLAAAIEASDKTCLLYTSPSPRDH